MKIRGLSILCNRDTLRNLDWIIDELVLPGGYTHLIGVLSYHFQCHPELGRTRGDEKSLFLEKDELLKLHCRVEQKGIKFIPLLGLWGYNPITEPHPELAENKGIPKSYCPRNPVIQILVEDMLSEIIGLLHPKYFHVGLDEINDYTTPMLNQIGNKDCTRCRMDSPAHIFAEGINRLNDLCKKKGCAMMMWGDQLLPYPPEDNIGYWYDNDNWVEAKLGEATYKAIDEIDREVIITDWHYYNYPNYPSIDYFLKKGFKVIGCPASYYLDNITGFSDYIKAKGPSEQLPGMIMTFWGRPCHRCDAKEDERYGFIDDQKVMDAVLLAGRHFR